jgi:hypothetical protein
MIHFFWCEVPNPSPEIGVIENVQLLNSYWSCNGVQ